VSLALADPALSACEDPAPGSWWSRWAFWRSPQGQPRCARPGLLAVATLAALLYAWNIRNAGLAPVYSVAVKSMSQSWKAFFYGAFDPRATVTIDKLAGAFLPQALSARMFGFHALSLALPQVIEGVITVLVMYRVVRRWAGVAPGLLAAAVFALTPIAASMFGHGSRDRRRGKPRAGQAVRSQVRPGDWLADSVRGASSRARPACPVAGRPY
jgi:Dolichyl-phosphate-mannose-protein mannosyltransferase